MGLKLFKIHDDFYVNKQISENNEYNIHYNLLLK